MKVWIVARKQIGRKTDIQRGTLTDRFSGMQEAGRQTNRLAGRQMDRQANRSAGNQTD